MSGDPGAKEPQPHERSVPARSAIATNAAVMTLGSYGYSREYPVEKWLRDAKLELDKHLALVKAATTLVAPFCESSSEFRPCGAVARRCYQRGFEVEVERG